MGEYAEMMLDGTCCSGCGEFLDANTGYPVMCGACERALHAPKHETRAKSKNQTEEKPCIKAESKRNMIMQKWYGGKGKIKCHVCGKRVKAAGLGQHLAQVHPEIWS